MAERDKVSELQDDEWCQRRELLVQSAGPPRLSLCLPAPPAP